MKVQVLKKSVSGAPALELQLVTKKLPLNILGTLNRSFPLTIDKSLADGTPPTAAAVDAPVLRALGLESDGIFASMTYGPAAGFPFAEESILALLPSIKQYPHVLHGNDTTATQLAKRAASSVSDAVAFDRLVVSFDDFQADPKSCESHLEKGGVLVVFFKLATSASETYADTVLAAEFVGNKDLHAQQVILQGHVGPVMAPVAQWLKIKPPVCNPVSGPDLGQLKSTYLDYFNEKTGTTFKDGVLAPGGCSGALYTALEHSSHTDTCIYAPFFAPQHGISEAAYQNVTVADSWSALVERINAKPEGGNCLITFPNNPDGNIPTEAQMAELIEVANGKNWTLYIDMTYFNVVKPEELQAFQRITQMVEKSAKSFVITASASKALAGTKYRTALVMADPANLEGLNRVTDRLDVVSALGLAEALKPENRREHEAVLAHNVKANTHWLTKIVGEGVTSDELAGLNSGLKKFNQLARELEAQFPGRKLTIAFGKGALYAKLMVPAEARSWFAARAKELNLAMVPGDVFSGKSGMDVKDGIVTIDGTPVASDWYRLSLMAKATI